jgi:hypothetical protein
VRDLRRTISELMKGTASNDNGWTCWKGQCSGLSTQLKEGLNAFAPGKFRIKYRSFFGKRLLSGHEVGISHNYLEEVSEHPPIIIDPTYLQWFRHPTAMKEPELFVGTREDLVRFFERHQLEILRPAGLPSDVPIDPAEFVSYMWAP